MKSKFDLEKYKGDYVMHCPEIWMAETFCSYLDEQGRRWCDNNAYTEINTWDQYREETCYRFNEGEYCDIFYFECEGFHVLEFVDFDWGNTQNENPVFHLEDYPGDYVMHCPERWMAEEFCSHMLVPDPGCLASYWEKFKENTCYHFNNGTYDRASYFQGRGSKFLEFTNFDWGNESLEVSAELFDFIGTFNGG